jgi:uncharacterized membrane protein YdjX (TVP38/TMEM64 family)
MILIRLCPIIPFLTFNLALSLTALTLKDFILGGIIGFIPGFILRIFIGTSLSALTDETSALKNNPWLVGMIVVGTILAIAGIIYITMVTKKHLKEMNLNSEEGTVPEAAAQIPESEMVTS